MIKLKKGDTVAIVACSNGQAHIYKEKINSLLKILEKLGLVILCSDTLYERKGVLNGTPIEKAEWVNRFFRDSKVKAIFDISGGDLANEVLPYLDYQSIRSHPKPFFGYSDLTTVLNALYSKTQNKTYLYQIRNLINEFGELQQEYFKETLLEGKNSLYEFKYDWIQGDRLEGVVIGGNIRCFLKLAGTPYMPSFENKILFLESLGGKVAQMTTYLNQYKQIGVFDKIQGILLGTYSTMESEKLTPTIEELVCSIVNNPNMPIAKTYEIGHRSDSKCLIIGQDIHLTR